MPHLHPFKESFWSPTASIDPIPNFSTGCTVLHNKLKQSMAENKAIINYIKQRINAEKTHATLLAKIARPTSPFEKDIGGALRKCFEVVCAESDESAKEHSIRADNLNTTALDPLVQFSNRYDRIITQAKKTVDTHMAQFNLACKAMEDAKTAYVNRCKTLLSVQPEYTDVTVGKSLHFPTRDHAWIWFTELFKENEYTKEQIMDLLKATVLDEENVMTDLVELQFLRQENNKFIKLRNLIVVDGSETTSIDGSKRNSGFLGRWGGHPQQAKKEDLISHMLEADQLYRRCVNKVELMRIQTEQVLFVHYEEMESLELERIQTIKQAFISMAASLSNTIPRCKETFDNMMLYQETLKPDKDVQFIVEQYRTGQYCPKPILYENYFHSTAADQLFGVPLEEITQVQCSMVPQLMSVGLSVIESGFSQLYDEEKNAVWTASLPLDRVHAARAEINSNKPITRKLLQKFDLLLLASLLRLYLLELPECLFTFELYEPCKLLYSNNQDKDSRLMSISKLLATLPTANYHTVMTLLGHFHKLVKQITTDTQFTSYALARSFSYILMRPQIESKISIHERHPQRLLYDLIENFDAIFTKESHHAQEKSSKRPSIIIPKKEPATSIESSSNHSNTSARTSTSSIHNTRRRSSILSPFMRSSQSSPTGAKPKPPLIIPMPSSSTLFEDPDEIERSSESTVLTTPPSSAFIEPHHKSFDYNFMMDELASVDSFFEDED